MSSRAQNWAKQVRTGSAARKALLLVMADEATDQGHLYGFGSVSGREWNYRLEHYAEQAEMSRPSAYRHLAALQELGLLVVDQQGGLCAGGAKKRSKYRLNIPADFAVLSGSGSQSQNETKGASPQSQNETDTSLKMRQAPVSKRDTTQSYIPNITQERAEASPPPALADDSAVGFLLDDSTTIGDLPVGCDVKAVLPEGLQAQWPFSFSGYPSWVPVQAFACWADACARNGKRIQPSQLPAMLQMLEQHAQHGGVSPAEYINFHLAKGIRSFRQIAPSEFRPTETAPHENSSSPSPADQSAESFGDWSEFYTDEHGVDEFTRRQAGGAAVAGDDDALRGEVV